MALTLENVEKVLDELRPFLMADGGNVELVEIDGLTVRVRLQVRLECRKQVEYSLRPPRPFADPSSVGRARAVPAPLQ